MSLTKYNTTNTLLHYGSTLYQTGLWKYSSNAYGLFTLLRSSQLKNIKVINTEQLEQTVMYSNYIFKPIKA